MGLIDRLIKDGWLKTPEIIDAFKKVKREDFLPDSLKKFAEEDRALPIGMGQTISQPLTVAFMMELLQPRAGDDVLDIGSGSGWTAALLGEIVGRKGKVIALEIVPVLKEFGERNAGKYNQGQIGFFLADASQGFEAEAPYDRILCSAALAKEVPQAWQSQLNPKGLIVAPINSSVWRFHKTKEGKLSGEEFPGFAFVPFIEN